MHKQLQLWLLLAPASAEDDGLGPTGCRCVGEPLLLVGMPTQLPTTVRPVTSSCGQQPQVAGC
jgi:hypothetical protein